MIIRKPPVPIGVGIDTARYGHHVSFLLDPEREALPPFRFEESAAGYALLARAFERLVARHGEVHLQIRVDAAGRYAENLLRWLDRLPVPHTLSVGQPARNEAYRRAHCDKRKADPVESRLCARFAIVELPRGMADVPPAFARLRDAVAAQEACAKQRTRLVNQLHADLAVAFPELATLVPDLGKLHVLRMLRRWPTAERIARARPRSLEAVPHLDPELAGRIRHAAAQSTGSARGEVAAALIQDQAEAILQLDKRAARLARITRTAWETLPDGPHRRLLTIQGIGLQTAAALAAKIVDIRRFATPANLVGYFGVFPEEVDVSGVDRHGRPRTGARHAMSSKGNDLVRRLLYMAAQAAARHNPAVRDLYARQRGRGKPHRQALGHCMAKLLRQVFAVWSQDQNYDPRRGAPAEAEDPPGAEAVVDAGLPEASGGETKTAVGHKAVEPPRSVVTTASSSVAPAARSGKRRPLDFARLREQAPIARVLELLGWAPTSARGEHWRGPCPLHRRDEPAGPRSREFEVTPGKGVFHCHRCGAQGNALDLWTAARGQELLEAAWELVDRLGIEPPLLRSAPRRPQPRNREEAPVSPPPPDQETPP